MKTLLALLLSCLTLSAATTYPVLTDSTNRLFPGGVTNVFFLNSNVVTTGTMRATGALTLTNSGNVFAGDGSGLTGINGGISTSNGLGTNLTVFAVGASNALQAVATNGSVFRITKDGQIINNSGPSVPGLGAFIGDTVGSGLEIIGGTLFGLYSGSYFFTLNQGGANGMILPSYGRFGLSSGASASTATMDVALSRTSSSGMQVNNGTDNVLRDFWARSVYATNLYATNLIINGGATVTKILSATATLNFDLSAVTVEDLTITVTGAADGDVVTLGVPNGSVTTSVQYSAWVSAADTVTVRARTSATGENPASGTFRATVIKH